MLVVTSYILRLLAPVVNCLGIIGFIWYIMCILGGDPSSETHEATMEAFGKIGYAKGGMLFVISIVVFILGLWYGVKAYKNDIPVRWLWSKSKNALFEYSLTTVVGYAFYIVAYPYAIFFIHILILQLKISIHI